MVGTVCILVGVFGSQFYPDDDNPSSEPLPTWFGKSQSIGIGILFLLAGLGGIYYGH